MSGERKHICSAYFTFVQVKFKGKEERPLKQVVPSSPEDLRRHVEALERRDMVISIANFC